MLGGEVLLHMIIITMKMCLSVVLKYLIIVYFRLTFYFPLIAVFTRHVCYNQCCQVLGLTGELGYFYNDAAGWSKGPCPPKAEGETLEGGFWPSVIWFWYNFYSHFPQKCDWDSFSHDWASFEYQLGWFCYADLATRITTM